jgi:DnaB-like helicase N terminal domain.
MNNRQPHNIEAEQSVIGAAFISKSALQKVCEELDNTSFLMKRMVRFLMF